MTPDASFSMMISSSSSVCSPPPQTGGGGKGEEERVADIWEKRKRWKKMVDLSNWQMIPTASLSELAAPSIY